MSAEIPITPSQLRKQGEQLVEYGKRIVEAGEQQIEAAQKIEDSYALLSQRQFSTPLPQPLDNSESEISEHQASVREYISAISAAQISLMKGPLELHILHERITSMGARCKNRMSLATMLRQHPDKFEYAGGAKWQLVGVRGRYAASLNGHEKKIEPNDPFL